MGEQAALQRRRPVGAGTLGFAVVCLLLSLCLVLLNGIGNGVGASGVRTSRSHGSAVHARATVVSTNRQFSSHYWGSDDVPPRPKPPESAPPTASPAAPATESQVSTPPPAPAPPPPPAPAALPGRGAATAYGCAAALAYLASYSAPGFTFQCPGGGSATRP